MKARSKEDKLKDWASQSTISKAIPTKDSGKTISPKDRAKKRGLEYRSTKGNSGEESKREKEITKGLETMSIRAFFQKESLREWAK